LYNSIDFLHFLVICARFMFATRKLRSKISRLNIFLCSYINNRSQVSRRRYFRGISNTQSLSMLVSPRWLVHLNTSRITQARMTHPSETSRTSVLIIHCILIIAFIILCNPISVSAITSVMIVYLNFNDSYSITIIISKNIILTNYYKEIRQC
jgi:hypothetical protein